MRKIIHIDMDCFYAAIEMRDYPELKNKPIAVGGDANRRGVISTCNYAARKFGVRSAMATAYAFRLCPELILQPGRMNIYKEESNHIRQIFAEYTDLIEPLSLDEAFLDVTDCDKCQGSATWIAQEIREKIYQSRGITASAGIAPNKSLAKIASDWHKPNGQKVILPDQIPGFVEKLPVRKLFGVGPKMEEKLHAIDIKTCKDLQKYELDDLSERFGSMGKRLYELARGIDERPVNPNRIRKSISVEETYSEDLKEVDSCINAMPELKVRLETRIDRLNQPIEIHNIFVKVKFSDFNQTTVEQVAEKLDINIINHLVREGYARKQLPVRLLGLGVKIRQNATENNPQLSLPGLI